MPLEPTLAKLHDRQPIKEYNDLPTLQHLPSCPPPPPPQSQHFSLCVLINFQTNLFIIHRRLSAEVAQHNRSFAHHVWLHFDFENGQELFIDCPPQRRGAQSPSFISSSTSSPVILHFKPAWPSLKGLAVLSREPFGHAVQEERLARGFPKAKPSCSSLETNKGLIMSCQIRPYLNSPFECMQHSQTRMVELHLCQEETARHTFVCLEPLTRRWSAIEELHLCTMHRPLGLSLCSSSSGNCDDHMQPVLVKPTFPRAKILSCNYFHSVTQSIITWSSIVICRVGGLTSDPRQMEPSAYLRPMQSGCKIKIIKMQLPHKKTRWTMSEMRHKNTAWSSSHVPLVYEASEEH